MAFQHRKTGWIIYNFASSDRRMQDIQISRRAKTYLRERILLVDAFNVTFCKEGEATVKLRIKL